MKTNQVKAELTAADNKISMSAIHENRFATPMQTQSPAGRAGEDKNDG